jgi:hypothetical protein
MLAWQRPATFWVTGHKFTDASPLLVPIDQMIMSSDLVSSRLSFHSTSYRRILWSQTSSKKIRCQTVDRFQQIIPSRRTNSWITPIECLRHTWIPRIVYKLHVVHNNSFLCYSRLLLSHHRFRSVGECQSRVSLLPRSKSARVRYQALVPILECHDK